jgi:hypothetical protein
MPIERLIKLAVLVGASALAYAIGVALATTAFNRPDGTCAEGSSMVVAGALIVGGLLGALWTAIWVGPGWMRLTLVVMVLLLTLASAAITVAFYGLCGMG